MTNRSFAWSRSKAGTVFVVALALLLDITAAQAGEKVILQFNPTQGYRSFSGLTSDGAGNLYGTTTTGGAANCGTAFELFPGSGGTWTETVLYSFRGCPYPGPSPSGTMVFDKKGNLYGVSLGNLTGGGVIFELSKGTNGTWSYRTIHTFSSSEGAPFGDLTWDTGGNLYGATSLNTTTSNGEIFELSPQANGSWKETVLYTFPSPDGVGIPQSGVIFDNAGNLYGVTFLGTGGIGTQGAVFELSPQATGPWKLTVIYNFTNGNTGGDPTSRLTFDSSGSLYGILSLPQYGTIFKLSPASGGTWNIKTVHTFNSGSDGNFPQGTLVVDASGNIYGTTTYGGLGCNGSLCGVVYKLTPQSGGTWKETILHQFESAGDGSEPQRGVLLDSSGNLYGTTYFGGSRYGYGTVYEITP